MALAPIPLRGFTPIKMDPLKSLLNSAFASAREGAYPAALDTFKIVLSHNPHHAGALFGAAGCHYRMSNKDAALEFLQRLLKVNPSHPEGLKLLREIRTGEIGPKVGPADEDILNPEMGFIDPFGTGLDKQNREIEIIPEWQAPGRDIPGIGEAFREGMSTCQSKFQIGKVYRDAWRFSRENFRTLYFASLFSLFVWVSVWAPFIYWLFESWGEGKVIAFSRIGATILLLPTTGLLSFYAFQIRNDNNLPLVQSQLFLNHYPGVLFSLGWLLLPVFLAVSLLYGFAFLAGFFVDYSLGAWVYAYSLEIAIVMIVYLGFRCWFLHQSAYTQVEDHPLTILGRAYYATRGQHIRLFFFIVLQTIFFIGGTLLLGLGIPLVHAAQTEAFLQTQSTEKMKSEKIGFIPKRVEGH